MPAPIPQQISRILPKFQNVAQSNHYLVKFGLPKGSSFDPNTLVGHLRSKGVDTRFQLDDVGLLCSSASLPGSAFATINTVGDYQGVVERFAHTRNYTQISLEFYVDNLYKSLKFLEHWMEYISGASQPNLDESAYHFRMRYPEDYKSDETRVIKFERNYRQFIEYKFIGLFPMSLNSTRVSYEGAQVLKATCNFSYDRYIAGETTSFAFDRGTALNNADFNRQKSQFTTSFGKYSKNLFPRSNSSDNTAVTDARGQTSVRPASDANPIVGAQAYLESQGLSKEIINGINDIEAGRNRD